MSRPNHFSQMSLTALRKYAKDVHGLQGLSKAPREIVQGAINAARQAKPMSQDARVRVYLEQRNVMYFSDDPAMWPVDKLSPRQMRRLRKSYRKARG